MVDKELIEIWRNSIKTSIGLWLLNTSYEEMGEQDKEEFERDFDEILDLALIGLKHKAQLFQEGTTSDLISRQAAIDAVNNAFDRETLLTGFVRSIAVRAIRNMPPAQPEEAIPVAWISAQIERLKGMDNLFADLTADIIQTTLNEWRKEQEGKTT